MFVHTMIEQSDVLALAQSSCLRTSVTRLPRAVASRMAELKAEIEARQIVAERLRAEERDIAARRRVWRQSWPV